MFSIESISPDSRPIARRTGLMVQQLDEESVVYDIAHDCVHYLNRTSRMIWESCDGNRSARHIADDLIRRIGDSLSATGIREDVLHAIKELSRNGLVDLHG